MPRSARKESTARLAGYEELLARFRLQVIPNWHRSFVGTRTAHRIERRPGAIVEIYPKRYWPGDSLGDHLEFALKYDGVNLAILDTLFRTVPSKDILAGVKANRPESMRGNCGSSMSS